MAKGGTVPSGRALNVGSQIAVSGRSSREPTSGGARRSIAAIVSCVRAEPTIEAETLYRQVLAVREHRLESDDPDIYLSLNTLAVCLLKEHRPAEAEPLLQTAFSESNGEISPDGRWLAYQSDESGQRDEIYVRPFPNVSAGRSQISTNGGTRPVWARNGRELFYLGADGLLMMAPVQMAPTFSVGSPRKISDTRTFSALGGRSYDVSLDGQRFLMIKDTTADQSSPDQIVVVVNWFEELKRLVPTGGR